jgi:hypothetical protein
MSHTTRLKLLKAEVAAPPVASKTLPTSVPMLKVTREAMLGDLKVALRCKSALSRLVEVHSQKQAGAAGQRNSRANRPAAKQQQHVEVLNIAAAVSVVQLNMYLCQVAKSTSGTTYDEVLFPLLSFLTTLPSSPKLTKSGCLQQEQQQQQQQQRKGLRDSVQQLCMHNLLSPAA